MTGFTSKRRIALDRLDDDDIQVYARPWVGLTDEEIAYAYTLEKKFAMQYVDAKLKEKNFD